MVGTGKKLQAWGKLHKPTQGVEILYGGGKGNPRDTITSGKTPSVTIDREADR